MMPDAGLLGRKLGNIPIFHSHDYNIISFLFVLSSQQVTVAGFSMIPKELK